MQEAIYDGPVQVAMIFDSTEDAVIAWSKSHEPSSCGARSAGWRGARIVRGWRGARRAGSSHWREFAAAWWIERCAWRREWATARKATAQKHECAGEYTSAFVGTPELEALQSRGSSVRFLCSERADVRTALRSGVSFGVRTAQE